MVDTGGHLKCLRMYNSLVLLKACGNIYFLYAAIRLRYLYKKTYRYRMCSFIPKKTNTKETSMHTRLSLVLYALVQKASHLRYKILTERNRATLSRANNVLRAHHNDYNNISGRWNQGVRHPGLE